MLSVQSTPLNGLFLIEPESTHDVRGVVRPGFHPTEYAAHGMTSRFASDRHVRSFQGTLRGLYILPTDQAMLFNLIRGDVTLAVVDTRVDSRTFGKIHMIDITESNNRQVYVPGGMAYGYCVRSEIVDCVEKFTGIYDATAIQGLFWNDADLNIQWPVKFPLITDEENRFPGMKALFPVFA